MSNINIHPRKHEPRSGGAHPSVWAMHGGLFLFFTAQCEDFASYIAVLESRLTVPQFLELQSLRGATVPQLQACGISHSLPASPCCKDREFCKQSPATITMAPLTQWSPHTSCPRLGIARASTFTLICREGLLNWARPVRRPEKQLMHSPADKETFTANGVNPIG